VRALLGMFEPRTQHEVNRWDDMRPFLQEMARYLKRTS